jgi:hypothetical protein
MFRFVKGAAVGLVRPYLRAFIDEESLDGDLVTFGVDGRLELNNVKLNVPSLLKTTGLDLPIQITAAQVGKLRLALNWTSLLSSPIHVELDSLHVVASTTKTVAAADRVEGAAARLPSTLPSSLTSPPPPRPGCPCRSRPGCAGCPHQCAQAGLRGRTG